MHHTRVPTRPEVIAGAECIKAFVCESGGAKEGVDASPVWDGGGLGECEETFGDALSGFGFGVSGDDALVLNERGDEIT